MSGNDAILVGPSTGIDATLRGKWDQLLPSPAHYRTVELSALHASELPGLCRWLSTPAADAALADFASVSVHAPSKGVVDHDAIVDELQELPLTVQRVIAHPDVLRHNWTPWARLGRRLVVENMDPRKTFGTTPFSIAETFEALPDARFCLDVAHAWACDPSLQLAHDLLDIFGDRLAEVHFSGITTQGTHVPTSRTHIRRYAPALERCTDVPWVLESTWTDRADPVTCLSLRHPVAT